MSSKLREALLKADVLISIATFEEGVKMDEVDKIRSEIKAVLSEPLCNCDIYTMEEQSKRYEEYCKSHSFNGRCVKCPLWQMRLLGINCAIAWTNLPSDALEDNKKVANEKS